MIKLLLDAGVKIALAGPDRMTALHFAAAKGDFDTVQFLVDHGAKVLTKKRRSRIATNFCAVTLDRPRAAPKLE